MVNFVRRRGSLVQKMNEGLKIFNTSFIQNQFDLTAPGSPENHLAHCSRRTPYLDSFITSTCLILQRNMTLVIMFSDWYRHPPMQTIEGETR